MTDLGGVVDYTTDRVVFSLPSNAKKFLFLVSDFIVTENKDQLTDAIAKAKSASWTVRYFSFCYCYYFIVFFLVCDA